MRKQDVSTGTFNRIGSHPTVNFINVKRANFSYEIMAQKPKRNYKKGRSYEKFVRKTLMKLTPDTHFYNNLYEMCYMLDSQILK